jgi:hypothetical protein
MREHGADGYGCAGIGFFNVRTRCDAAAASRDRGPA